MRRPARTIAIALAVLATGLALSWFDVLPGGWTLRGLVEPHHIREAREQHARSEARLALFAPENASVPAGSIVFLGSSTIERFPLPDSFPGRVCVNRGIGNETAVELFERLERSLPDAAPAGFVLYAGSLDFRRERQTADAVVARVRRIVNALRERAPKAAIAMLGLLSERGISAELRAELTQTNAALESYAAETGIDFIALDRAPLTASDGSLDEAYSADRLHLSDSGYVFVAQWLGELPWIGSSERDE